MTTKDEIQRALSSLDPHMQTFAKSVAMMKLQNKQYEQQLAALKAQHTELYKILITLLHAYPEQTMRIHESQFLRFKEEYRIDRSFDMVSREVVLRLLTLRD